MQHVNCLGFLLQHLREAPLQAERAAAVGLRRDAAATRLLETASQQSVPPSDYYRPLAPPAGDLILF